MILLLLVPLMLCSCSSTSNYRNGMQEDNITWEWDKRTDSRPSTRNMNNNLLDSPDGSSYIGDGMGASIRF